MYNVNIWFHPPQGLLFLHRLGEMWCKKLWGAMMAKPKQNDSQAMVRRSVSLPADEYAELERIAGETRVSVSWVVRDAVSRYLAARTPLFRQSVAGKSQQ